MGNLWAKEPPSTPTGMTKHENKLVHRTWNMFCSKRPDFGSFLLLAMFTEHPDTQTVFPKFKGRELRKLRDDAKFRAFGDAVGQQLAAIIESVDDYEALLSLARQTAVEHARLEGLQVKHFQLFFSVLLTQMLESNRSAMTTAVVAAWEKLFQTLKTITRQAFDEAAEEAKHSERTKETKSSPHHKRHSSPRKPASRKISSVASPATPRSPISHHATSPKSPLAIQSVIRGTHSERQSIWKSAVENKGKHSKRSP
ncbi:myoglobin [Rhipicephalus sanguineus]|uniref:Globin domain-containing protein n=1 Tax=Rhipicephalus sanguineus TaxID=34632 RepID=A0A9D4T6J2_RHISA|nr:myoglobin [Rhipicephalus sanguineus]KAH7973320.1 hypothetical protein HPB52_024128 [Rhipicephalus sanguineus]